MNGPSLSSIPLVTSHEILQSHNHGFWFKLTCLVEFQTNKDSDNVVKALLLKSMFGIP